MIEVKELTRKFGRKTALDRLSFQVFKGDLFGLVGPNGAGKTTLLRILATLLRPSSGQVRIAEMGLGRRPNRVRWKIGYVPDAFGLYPDLSVKEYLDFFGSIYRIRGKKRRETLHDLLRLVDLESKAEEPVERLSRGMQQRLSLARCLFHDPEVLLLDEPASGLDPHARREIRSLLSELQQMGKTIVLSSHHLADVHELCNRLLIMEEGRAEYCGSMEELLANYGGRETHFLGVAGQTDKALEFLLARADIARASASNGQIEFELQPEAANPAALIRDLARAGFEIHEVRRAEDTLEDVFARVTTGKVS